MRRTYFVDAWYFVALLEPRDTHHRNAARLARFVAGADLVTHDFVLSEVLAYFAEEGARARSLATRMVRQALDEIAVVISDRPLFVRSLELYESRDDKQYSLADCLSFVLMRDRNITHVLTNDHHFRQEGFTVLSDAP